MKQANKIFNSHVLTIFLWVVMLCISINCMGQQRPAFTQYTYNTLTLNPGYVSSSSGTELTSIIRTQWLGTEGAPETQTLSYLTRLGESGLGLGVNILNDKIGPVSQQTLTAALAYRIRTGSETHLSLGINFGGNLFNTDWSKGQFQNPEAIFNENINSRFLVQLGVGLYFFSEDYYIGISVPNFLKPNFYDNINESIGQEDLTYYGMAGMVLRVNEDVKFKPAILTMITAGVPVTVDLSMSLLFRDRFSLGLSHRFSDSLSGLLGLQISDSLTFGYSYDFTTSHHFRFYNVGTHEVFLKYHLDKNKKKRRFF